MPSEVEAVAVELDGLGDPADRSVGLEDVAGAAPAREHPGGGEASGTGPEYGCSQAVAAAPVAVSTGAPTGAAVDLFGGGTSSV